MNEETKDLLEAAEHALEWMMDFCPELSGQMTMDLEAAIKKAKGESDV